MKDLFFFFFNDFPGFFIFLFIFFENCTAPLMCHLRGTWSSNHFDHWSSLLVTDRTFCIVRWKCFLTPLVVFFCFCFLRGGRTSTWSWSLFSLLPVETRFVYIHEFLCYDVQLCGTLAAWRRSCFVFHPTHPPPPPPTPLCNWSFLQHRNTQDSEVPFSKRKTRCFLLFYFFPLYLRLSF